MKIILVIMSGFFLSLTTYAAGIITAIFFLEAEPVPVRSPSADTAEVWTNEPVTVNTAAQNFERLQAKPARKLTAPTEGPKAGSPEIIARAEPLVDLTTTGAILSEAAPGIKSIDAPTMNTAHYKWCSERYRSYRPNDNSYTSYSGMKRECVSPYLAKGDNGSQSNGSQSYVETLDDRPLVGYAVLDEELGGHLTSEHVQSCFNRYRSYRPEDNSYQPYGGGPRRQCR